MTPLPAPAYTGNSGLNRMALAVESMKDHMTDEGWQIMLGLRHAGYRLAGRGCEINCCNVESVVRNRNPNVVLVQDKREWDVSNMRGNFRDPAARFVNYESLAERHDVFKLTILKDAHNSPTYHEQSAREMGVHAWVIYYNPQRVHQLASYTRPQHLIRTYHSVNADVVPDYSPKCRTGCLLSGAVSNAYPLRRMLVNNLGQLPETTYLPHPGYHRNGTATNEFLKTLSRFKVAICTASVYGYALRKIIEATAAGCVVLTDLPYDDPLPGIDGNLVRVGPDATGRHMGTLIQMLCDEYEPARQEHYAKIAKQRYDYRAVGTILAEDIETMRATYTPGDA